MTPMALRLNPNDSSLWEALVLVIVDGLDKAGLKWFVQTLQAPAKTLAGYRVRVR